MARKIKIKIWGTCRNDGWKFIKNSSKQSRKFHTKKLKETLNFRAILVLYRTSVKYWSKFLFSHKEIICHPSFVPVCKKPGWEKHQWYFWWNRTRKRILINSAQMQHRFLNGIKRGKIQTRIWFPKMSLGNLNWVMWHKSGDEEMEKEISQCALAASMGGDKPHFVLNAASQFSSKYRWILEKAPFWTWGKWHQIKYWVVLEIASSKWELLFYFSTIKCCSLTPNPCEPAVLFTHKQMVF